MIKTSIQLIRQMGALFILLSLSLEVIGTKLRGVTYVPHHHRCNTNDMHRDYEYLLNKIENIRLYSTECKSVDMLLEKMEKKYKKSKVLLGIWTENGRFEKELPEMIAAINKHKSLINRITGVTVGNEELFKGKSEQGLIGMIKKTKEEFQKAGLSKIPIFTTDVPAKWTDSLFDVVDKIAVNIHPVFGFMKNDMKLAAQDALNQKNEFLKNKVPAKHNRKEILITEVGWPSGGTTKTPAKASQVNQVEFLQNWVCLNKNSKLKYYFFEAFDADWKEKDNPSSVEPFFGLLKNGRKLKPSIKFDFTC